MPLPFFKKFDVEGLMTVFSKENAETLTLMLVRVWPPGAAVVGFICVMSKGHPVSFDVRTEVVSL